LSWNGSGHCTCASGTAGKSGRRKIAVADWDGDGKPDLLLGAEDGFFYHLPHDESREYPAKGRTARKPK
jgi:hypothetical protein